ncbi:hypothetical protein [Stenotrophomonas sp. JAG2]|uniref:hypothetical protein n=1 Tax=Stenotrophomonas sp. JAG2 TaxID=3229243 RepID=UPI0034E28DE4
MATRAYQRREAAFRHSEIRELTCSIVEALFATEAPQLELRDTEDHDLLAVQDWRDSWPEAMVHIKPNWEWEIERRKIIRREARLDLAICSGETLQGIALGRVSRRRVVATIHFMERNPSRNPFEDLVGPICVTYLEELAKLLRCKEICIDRPVEALLDYYAALGFSRAIRKGRRIVRLVKIIPVDESQAVSDNHVANGEAL